MVKLGSIKTIIKGSLVDIIQHHQIADIFFFVEASTREPSTLSTSFVGIVYCHRGLVKKDRQRSCEVDIWTRLVHGKLSGLIG